MFTSKLLQRQADSKPDLEELQRKLFDSGIEKDPMLSELRGTTSGRGARGQTPPTKPNVRSNQPIQVMRPRERIPRKSSPRSRTQDKVNTSQVIGSSFGDLKDYQAESKSRQEPKSSSIGRGPAIFESQFGQQNIEAGSHFFRQNSGKSYGEGTGNDQKKISNVSISKVVQRPPQASQRPPPSPQTMFSPQSQPAANNVSFSEQNHGYNDNSGVERSFHKIDQRNYGAARSFSSKATKKPIMIMNLDVGEGKQAKVFIFQDTDPWQKAFDFVENHNLPEEMVDPLAELIEQNKQKGLETLTKNTMRTNRDQEGISDLLSENSTRPKRGQSPNAIVSNRGNLENYNIRGIIPNTQLRDDNRIKVPNQDFRQEEMYAQRPLTGTVSHTARFDGLSPASPLIGTQSSKNLGVADRLDQRRAPKAIFDSNFGSTPHIYRPPVHTQFDRSPTAGIDLNYGKFNVGHRQVMDSNMSVDLTNREQVRPQRTGYLSPGGIQAKYQTEGNHEEEDQYYKTPNGTKPYIQSTIYTGLAGREPLRMEVVDKNMLRAIFDKIDIDGKGNIKAYEVNLTPLNKDLKLVLIEALSSIDNEPNVHGFKSISFDGFCRAVLDSGLLPNIKHLAMATH